MSKRTTLYMKNGTAKSVIGITTNQSTVAVFLSVF